MIKSKVLMVLFVTVSFSGSMLLAEEMTSNEGAAPVAVDSAQPADVGNKVCPISGESTTAMGNPVKEEYKGKVYNLCCAMCVKDFDKDPEMYVKKIEEEMNKQK